MADEREVTIVIRGQNLTQKDFDAARLGLSGLKKGVDDTGKSGETFGQKLLGAKSVTALFDDQVKHLVAGFTIASLLDKAAGSIVEWTGSIYENASALVKQHDRTGVSIEMLQKWQFAAEKSDISAQAFADGSVKLGMALQTTGAAGDNVRSVLKELGLNFDDLKAKTPEQRLDLVVRSLGNMDDITRRNYLATQLLTKGVADELSPALRDYEKNVSNANVQMTAQVLALHAQQEGFSDFIRSLKEGVGSYLGILSLLQQTVTSTAKGHTDLNSAWAAAQLIVKKQFLGLVDLDSVMKKLGMDVDARINQQAVLSSAEQAQVRDLVAHGKSAEEIAALYRSEVTPAIKAYASTLSTAKPEQVDYTKQLADAQSAVKGLTAEQRAQLAAGIALGTSDKDLAASVNAVGGKVLVTEAAVKLYKDQLQESKKAADDATQKHQALKDALDRAARSTVQVTDETRKQILAMKDRNVSESDIALILGKTAAQVSTVIEAEKARADQAKAQGKLIADIEKFNYDNSVKYWAGQRAIADAKGQKLIELVQLEESTGSRLDQMRADSHAKEILQINQSEADELRTLATKYDKGTQYYANTEANIRVFYQHQRDLANGMASTIEERMAQQGVYTKAQLDDQAHRLEVDYKQMVASGKYNLDELKAAHDRWKQAVEAANHSAFQSFLNGFDKVLAGAAAFASGVGGKFGEVANKAIGLASSVDDIAKAFSKGDWVSGTIQSLGLLGKVVGSFSNDTKKAREEFADQMGLSLDQLYNKLRSLGTEGEALANKALNVIGKHDETANRNWMNEVSKFFSDQEQKQADIAKAAADSADAQVAAVNKVKEAIQAQLTELDQKRQSLMDSIANEAPEAVMGIVEAQTRAQIDGLDQQKTALQAQMDAQAAAGDAAVSQIKDTARQAYEATKDEWAQGLHVPVYYDSQNSPGGGGGYTQQYATGGIAEGRQIALLAERGQREIAGSEAFMTDALTGAINRLGGSIGSGGGPGGIGPINLYFAVDQTSGQVRGGLTRAQWQDLQRGVSGGKISIPTSSLARRNG